MRSSARVWNPRVLLAGTAALALAGLLGACSDDDTCTLPCPSGQVCVNDGGEQLCLVPDCGDQVCGAGEECVGGTCSAATSECSADCDAGTHCVSESCIADYTASNVCDPLRECRRACGTDAFCLDACEDDSSGQCETCRGIIADCESDNGCRADANNGCCEDEYCDCFPGDPECGNVAACIECQRDCGDDATCFSDCRRGDAACNVCLQPFDRCAEGAGGAGACVEQFCDCLDATLEPDCQ